MNVSFVMVTSIAMVMQASSPSPYAAWKYQRTVTLSSSAPSAEQCVVLDADTFARAAPGLRDLRLLQDGREIAYALDESHDEAFDQASTSEMKAEVPGNRALYETSLLIPAHPSNWAGAQSNGTQTRPDHPPGWFYGEDSLPAHVPVERIRILPNADQAEALDLDASQASHPRDRETLQAVLSADKPAVNFTVGANLQTAATIRIGVQGSMPVIQAFLLEMRRRELCFQPLSRSPLQLLLGNERARTVRYDYAAHFHPSAAPLIAALGLPQQNPSYQPGAPLHVWRPTVDGILLAIYTGCAVVIGTSLLFARRRAR